LQHTSGKTNETLRTKSCKIRVQPLQHPDLLLQCPHETFANIPLKHLKHMLATCDVNTMSPCYLDEWTLVVVELEAGTAHWRNNGAALFVATPAPLVARLQLSNAIR
jgi:hypothetical protein